MSWSTRDRPFRAGDRAISCTLDVAIGLPQSWSVRVSQTRMLPSSGEDMRRTSRQVSPPLYTRQDALQQSGKDETGQCHDSMNNMTFQWWRSSHRVPDRCPSIRIWCLENMHSLWSFTFQTWSNPEISYESSSFSMVHITRSLHVWKAPFQTRFPFGVGSNEKRFSGWFISHIVTRDLDKTAIRLSSAENATWDAYSTSLGPTRSQVVVSHNSRCPSDPAVKLNNYCNVYYCSLIYEPCLHKRGLLLRLNCHVTEPLCFSRDLSSLSGCLSISVG